MNGAVLNIISLRLSEHRTLLSILNAKLENTGEYMCSGVNNIGATSSDVVTVTICKLH